MVALRLEDHIKYYLRCQAAFCTAALCFDHNPYLGIYWIRLICTVCLLTKKIVKKRVFIDRSRQAGWIMFLIGGGRERLNKMAMSCNMLL